jgi:hypothetical protein
MSSCGATATRSRLKQWSSFALRPAAGKKSGEIKQYYAGRGNKHWRTLWEVGLTPCRLGPAEATSLLDFGFGLTDFVKGQSAAGSTIDFGRWCEPTRTRSSRSWLQSQLACCHDSVSRDGWAGTL